MSYASNRSERQQLSTPELYEFTCGDVKERVTSYRTSLTFLGNTFNAATIERGSLAHDNEFGSTSVQIKANLSATFRKFIANQPINPTNVKLYRALSTDLTDYVVLFDGQVKNVSIQNNAVQAQCESRSIHLKKRLPKYIYQADCNHDVFDAGCGLNAADWKVTGTLTLVSGSTVAASQWSNANGYPDGYWVGGVLVYNDTDMRLVIDHADDVLTLQIPFPSTVTASVSLDAYPGCDGCVETCINKFNNRLKFLGMTSIPSRNPVIWGFK